MQFLVSQSRRLSTVSFIENVVLSDCSETTYSRAAAALAAENRAAASPVPIERAVGVGSQLRQLIFHVDQAFSQSTPDPIHCPLSIRPSGLTVVFPIPNLLY